MSASTGGERWVDCRRRGKEGFCGFFPVVLGKYSSLLVVVALTTAVLCVRMRVKRGKECMMLTLPLRMSGLSFLDCDGLVSCCGLSVAHVLPCPANICVCVMGWGGQMNTELVSNDMMRDHHKVFTGCSAKVGGERKLAGRTHTC